MLRLTVMTRMLAVAGAIACVCTAALAEDTGPITYTDNGSHVLTVQSSAELEGSLYKYDYYLENDSLDWDIVSWTWDFNGNIYDVMPNPAATVEDDSYDWPIPYSVSANWEDLSWREEYFSDAKAPMMVTSIIKFSDDFYFEAPIYVPQATTGAVPEPSALLALTTGVIGLVTRRRK